MIDKTRNLLKAICSNLSRGEVANFVADAELLQCEIKIENDEIKLIEKALGNNVEVGGIAKSDLSELLLTIKECFEYEGDEGSHPNKNYLSSEKIESDIKEVLENLELLLVETPDIYAFWLAKGHPFYPVFWDFAFLAGNDKKCFVLIGSSSD